MLFDRWARAIDESAKSQSPRLILEMALVDLCQSEPLEPIGDLLERLEGLEGAAVGWRRAAPPGARRGARPAPSSASSPAASPARDAGRAGPRLP